MSEPTISDIRISLAADYCRIASKMDDVFAAQAISLAALDVLTLPISELEPETAAAFDGALSDGWQDISTAPRDGESVIVAAASGWVGEAWFDDHYDGWWSAGSHPTDAHDDQVYPTHWRPLPDPPPLSDGGES